MRAPVIPDAREPSAQRDTTSTVVRFHLPLSLFVASFYPFSPDLSVTHSIILLVRVRRHSLSVPLFRPMIDILSSSQIFFKFLPVNMQQRSCIQALR